MAHEPCPYVGRGGLKLRHALDVFGLDVRGLACADFGCNVGGFTDCLLQAGAARVAAVDTGYGALAWTLRQDPRVMVMERTSALHATPPTGLGPVGLVVIDMGWTPQRLCVPAALRWLAPGEGSRIVTLIKPHYEASDAGRGGLLERGVLRAEAAIEVLEVVKASLPALGARLIDVTRSPILGGKGKRNASGNAEWLALLEAESDPRGVDKTSGA